MASQKPPPMYSRGVKDFNLAPLVPKPVEEP
jgi:hypothetical protein